MSKPIVTELAGVCDLSWEKEKLNINVAKARQHRDGRVTGEVTATTTSEKYSPHLHQAQFNFTSTQARTSLAKVMHDKYPEADWSAVLEQLCFYVLSWVRKGEPVQELCTAHDFKAPEYLLYPIILKDEPTIIFGEAESAKSMMALFFSILIELPWIKNPFKLITLQTVTNALYLDWETSSGETGWRLKCLQSGLELPEMLLNYRRCTMPLADDLEQIQTMVRDTKSGFIIVDSIAAASGGDLNNAEVALRFFAALRQLKVSSLLIAHTAKDANTKNRTVFGSAYYHNSARSVWYIKRVSETDEDTINVGLFHRKHNNSRGFPPIGFRLTFNSNNTSVDLESVKDVGGFIQDVSLSSRVIELLKGGKLEGSVIADELDTSKEVIRVTLNRMKNKGNVYKFSDGKWGLSIQETL